MCFKLLLFRGGIALGIPLRFVLIVLWTAFICQPLQAQGDRRAAIHLYWGCQYLVNDPVPVTKEEIEQSSKCQSAIESVLNFNKDLPHNMAFCPQPPSATVTETAKVIVAFMKSHLSRLAERFDMMAYSALRIAWPCS
jgi:hypothetical protein